METPEYWFYNVIEPALQETQPSERMPPWLVRRSAERPGFQPRYEFHVGGEGGGVWSFDLSQSDVTVESESMEGPRIQVKLDAEVLDLIMTRQLNPRTAWLEGMLAVETTSLNLAEFPYELIEPYLQGV